jgi:serine/threonine-protein kinase RsbW
MYARAIIPSPASTACTWQRAYPGRGDQLRVMRADLRGVLAGCPCKDSVVFLANELAANAIRHSSSRAAGWFTIRVHDTPGDHVRAEIQDQGSSWDGDLSASPEHHGLWFLRTTADTFGTGGDQAGWIVWFQVNYPQTTTGPDDAAPAKGA